MTDTAVIDEKAIREVLNGIRAAWTANDADAFADLYTADAVVVLPGGTYKKGREEIRAHMKAGYAGPMKGTQGVDEPEQVRIISGDAAIVISKAGILLPGETELPPKRLRRATWVLSKRGDKWAIEAYTNSPPADPIPGPMARPRLAGGPSPFSVAIPHFERTPDLPAKLASSAATNPRRNFFPRFW